MQFNGADGAEFVPGFVTMIGPGIPDLHAFFTVNLVNVFVPVSKSRNFTFDGVLPLIVTLAPDLMFVPKISNVNAPVSSRFS